VYKRQSASIVTVLLYTYPAMVALATAALDRARLARRRTLALVLTFTGAALAVGLLDGRAQANVLGVALALGAAIGYAAFSLLSARILRGRDRLVPMAYMFAFSAVGIGTVTILTGESLLPVGWSGATWTLLAAIVVLPTLAAVLLYLRGIEHLGAPRAAIVSTAEPIFTIALAALVLGERLSAAQVAGAALVIAGIATAEWPASAGTDTIADGMPPV
jgi:drug/metabolite transporter (DMT)-like permease